MPEATIDQPCYDRRSARIRQHQCPHHDCTFQHQRSMNRLNAHLEKAHSAQPLSEHHHLPHNMVPCHQCNLIIDRRATVRHASSCPGIVGNQGQSSSGATDPAHHPSPGSSAGKRIMTGMDPCLRSLSPRVPIQHQPAPPASPRLLIRLNRHPHRCKLPLPLQVLLQTPTNSQSRPPIQPISQTSECRRRQRRNVQAINPLLSSGITQATWTEMAQVDATPTLQQNIIALNKCPTHYGNLWRFAVAKVNQAGQFPDPLT